MAGSTDAAPSFSNPLARDSRPEPYARLLQGLRGENIAPREIDEVLLAHPAVREAAAVGIPERHCMQRLKLLDAPWPDR